MKDMRKKIPLFLSMFGSSVLIGISTYNSFPSQDMYLRYSVSIIGGASFDIILVSTVFSERKNITSYLTIFVAACIGLSIALDLYQNWGLVWLHALYILLSTCFALHLATTQDKTQSTAQITDQTLLTRLLRLGSRSSQEALRETKQIEAVSESRGSENGAQRGTETESEQSTEAHRKYKYQCVACGKKLGSVQAQNSSKRLGYCVQCKGKNKKV